jgi:uncharacterized protein YndB with AHSA1/START domain
MAQFSRTVDVKRPPEEVWRVLASRDVGNRWAISREKLKAAVGAGE